MRGVEAVRDTSLGKNGKCALILSQTLSELATSHDQDLQWGTMRDTQSGNSQVRHFHLQQRGREGEFKSRVKLLPVISSARSSQTLPFKLSVRDTKSVGGTKSLENIINQARLEAEKERLALQQKVTCQEMKYFQQNIFLGSRRGDLPGYVQTEQVFGLS